MGKQWGTASSSSNVCSHPSPSTRSFFVDFAKVPAVLQGPSWPGEVSSEGLGAWVVCREEPGLLCCGKGPHGPERVSLACRHSCSSLSSKGWTDAEGNPTWMCQDLERGWAKAGRRGCPNRPRSGLSLACDPPCVVALINTCQGCGENFVEGGECRGLDLPVSRAGFKPQWRESCKRFYFRIDGVKLEKMSKTQVTVGVLIHLG